VHDHVRHAARSAAAHVIVTDLDTPMLDPADCHHLESVRRLRPGESVSVTDGRGGWRLCSFLGSGLLRPEGEAVRGARPLPAITIGLAPVKGERTEWAIQKLTELGVDRIVMLIAARSVVHWDTERARRHLDKLAVVARQAVMQSRQMWLPEVTGMDRVDDWSGRPGVALAEPDGAAPTLDNATVLIGPEGGWTTAERESARATVTLGPAVLRTESAAVAAGVLLTALRAGVVRPG
jgi:16S rRNA (uracil1498-N3)-methyltransferase